MVFGAFDPLHEGHRHFLRQARALGDRLVVVVARDDSIGLNKGYQPYQPEAIRLAAVAAVPEVDRARLGNSGRHHYELLSEEQFEILALGYDQEPSDAVVRQQLKEAGKEQVSVVRLPPYQPERYKGAKLRRQLRR